MKRCMKCASLMPDDASKCIKCGFESAPKPAPAPVTRAAAPSIPPVIWAHAGEKPGKLRGSWLLVKQSWRVLMLDKELMVFPVLSTLAGILVLATFAAGIFASGIPQRGTPPSEVTVWFWLFVFYFANYFLMVFFNSALVACAMIRFQGGDPTVADGLRAATSRLPQIIAWALLAATVGVLLKMIQERVQFIGKIIIALLGAAWTIATYFIVPVLVVEKAGPVEAFQRSVSLMKETWGESLVATVGVGAAVTLVTVLFVMVGAVATAGLFLVTGSFGVLIACAILMVGLAMLPTLVGSALNAIVLAALYLYAAEKKVPQAFDGLEQIAFSPKG
jgi:hypothetical protein